ncbi:hypothetical protein J4460_02990 [Candidatus Woesearchaeota archaeon]|nr:MAG: hypothetical protein QS99_C0006G0020 [archaeon GW2011_AR4]MBS3129613.1 hypothetical protein [Candidatus Woesearchaeota archaeon]HIH37678.1 hypothetical protein [Candidatus Woesearchaeota archaeon]HIH49072.1 hypothetical protein [Candidatus Woesearchaeota archaeon]HIJ02923.1 hypothetical protein [Candidatus Woesearchaeota archaeon]
MAPVQKRFKIRLSAVDIIDVMFIKDNMTLIKFALNYRGFIGDEWHEIYRVDNFHGFLHEQKFWISPEPIPLDCIGDLMDIMTDYLIVIKENYKRYRGYYENKAT